MANVSINSVGNNVTNLILIFKKLSQYFANVLFICLDIGIATHKFEINVLLLTSSACHKF